MKFPLEFSCVTGESSPKLSTHEDRAPKRRGGSRDQTPYRYGSEIAKYPSSWKMLCYEKRKQRVRENSDPLQETMPPFAICSFRDCNNALAFSSIEFK